MKKEDLLKSMQGIEEKDLEESENYKQPVRRYQSIKVLAACACMILLVGAVYRAGFLFPNQQQKQEQAQFSQESVNDESAVVKEEAADTMTQMANPMEETDISQKLTEWKANLNIPQGAQNVQEFIIHGEEDSADLLERTYQLDQREYTVRVAKRASFEDISGMYYDWTKEEDIAVAGMQGEVMYDFRESEGEQESVAVCLWHDQNRGLMYSLSVTGSDLEDLDLVQLAKETCE